MPLKRFATFTNRAQRVYQVDSKKKDKLSVQKLADLSGVPYATIRKFESTGNISLRQFLMLFEAVGDLKKVKELTKPSEPQFKSVEDVLHNA